MENYKFLVAGDSAVTIAFEQRIDSAVSAHIRAARIAVAKAALPGVTELVQTYCTLMVHYDPLQTDWDAICAALRRVLAGVEQQGADGTKRVIEIPVCYGGDFGPDLEAVSTHTCLSPEQVVARHSGVDYQIYMLGFLPGFVYLGGMDEALATPRLATPRPRLEPGAVGIAGTQTGVYPLASPGGWQIIGRTPVRFYDPARAAPILCEAGEFIRFVPITAVQYREIEAQVSVGNHRCKVQEVTV